MAFSSPVVQRAPSRQLSVAGYGTAIKRMTLVGVSGSYGITPEATDAVGVFTLTLLGVVVGSAVHVESASGVVQFNGMASSGTVVIPLTAYANGSPLNDLVVKVRKGSSEPFYRPFQTQTTASPGAQTVFVSQIPD